MRGRAVRLSAIELLTCIQHETLYGTRFNAKRLNGAVRNGRKSPYLSVCEIHLLATCRSTFCRAMPHAVCFILNSAKN